MNNIDFKVDGHGSIYLFTAKTEAAIEFADEAFADAQTFGAAYAVEHRYAGPIIEDLVGNHGFIVSFKGDILEAAS